MKRVPKLNDTLWVNPSVRITLQRAFYRRSDETEWHEVRREA